MCKPIFLCPVDSERPSKHAGSFAYFGGSPAVPFRQGARLGQKRRSVRTKAKPCYSCQANGQISACRLYINLKAAKTLGITVPLPLSGRADELIE